MDKVINAYLLSPKFSLHIPTIKREMKTDEQSKFCKEEFEEEE